VSKFIRQVLTIVDFSHRRTISDDKPNLDRVVLESQLHTRSDNPYFGPNGINACGETCSLRILDDLRDGREQLEARSDIVRAFFTLRLVIFWVRLGGHPYVLLQDDRFMVIDPVRVSIDPDDLDCSLCAILQDDQSGVVRWEASNKPGCS